MEFELNGIKYPVREVSVVDGGTETVFLIGNESLQRAIFNHNEEDERDEYVSDEAQNIDEQIFFYAPDDVLLTDQLIEFLRENAGDYSQGVIFLE